MLPPILLPNLIARSLVHASCEPSGPSCKPSCEPSGPLIARSLVQASCESSVKTADSLLYDPGLCCNEDESDKLQGCNGGVLREGAW